MDYRSIIAAAAERKLIDLYKFFLDIVDEIKQDEDKGVENFKKAMGECKSVEGLDPLLIFLGPLNENKKQQQRKRILDRANDLIRELKQ